MTLPTPSTTATTATSPDFSNTDHQAMQLAIRASQQARAEGNMPFGATLSAPDGQVLLVAANRQVSDQDCSAHAEMVLVREAATRLGQAALRGSTVHASGEPCAMCSGVLFWAGVRRVVFGATTADIAEALGGPLLPMRCAEVLGSASPAVQVEGPLLREAAVAVLRGEPLPG